MALPRLFSYEAEQRKRTLSAILWVVLAASLALGVENLQYQTWRAIIALFVLSLACIPLLILNARGNYFLSALILSVLAFVAIDFNLYDGDGILDSAILAYPILIMTGTLLFGKRAAPYFALVSAGSAVAIVYLQLAGYIHPTIRTPTYENTIPIVILLLVAAVVVWVIVGNAEKNLARVKQSDAELLSNYDLTLQAWARVLEYRDRETQDHSRRLVDLSTRLARAAGLTEDEIVHLRRGALLHDIGKLAIPDEILLKPKALDENEKKVIEQHPALAKQMLSGLTFLEPAIGVVYSHHERWDGTGYPEGLSGEAIPLPARIFAIVDTWDALNSERIYRPAWPRERIIAYLQDNAGRIYDPVLIKLFLAII